MPKKIKTLITFSPKTITDESGNIIAVVATPPDKPNPESEPITWKELALRAHDVLCKLFEPCPVCQKAMLPVSWSGERISIVCGNSACNKFRQPGKYLRKADVQELIVQISKLEMLEMAEITGMLGADYVKQ